MKKIWILCIMLFGLSTFLVGCGKSEKDKIEEAGSQVYSAYKLTYMTMMDSVSKPYIIEYTITPKDGIVFVSYQGNVCAVGEENDEKQFKVHLLCKREMKRQKLGI